MPKQLRPYPRTLLLPALALLTLAFGSAGSAWGEQPRSANYAALAGALSPNEMRADIEALAALGSRVSGYPGADAAADYVRREFERYGLEVDEQLWDMPMPIDHGATLEVNGRRYGLHALWPNLVRTSKLPPGGVVGPLIYVGDGQLRHFNHLPVRNAIVVMNFNCGLNWVNAGLLDARAVIFIQPEETRRGEAETKFLRVPINLPRFYVDGDSAGDILAQCAVKPPRARVLADMTWQPRTHRNIIGFMRGSDPELAQQAIIIEAYYDSISIVPALSPGAENACGISALLQLVRFFRQHPPARTLIFVATPGHFEALAGAREFVDLWGREPRKERERGDHLQELHKQLDEHRRQLDQAERLLQTYQELRSRNASPEEIKRALKTKDFAYTPGQLLKRTARLKRVVQRAEHDIRLCERLTTDLSKIQMFVALDLSSRTRKLGVFQVGWYYNQANLLRFYSPAGKFFTHIADAAAPIFGYQADEIFVDGINPVKGREWYTHFPGKIAFDSEMAIRGGRPGIVFATTNDARSLVDTPLDTAREVNYANLHEQLKLLVCLLYRFVNNPALEEAPPKTEDIAEDETDQQATAGTSEEIQEEHPLKRVKALKKLDELKDVRGSVYEFRRESSFLPRTPVAGALVIVQGQDRMMMGMHTDLYAMADELSDFTLRGEMAGRGPLLEAYAFDPNNGNITYAPDLGPDGEVRYPRDVYGRAGLRRPIIVFPCEATDIYDLVDERYFETLEQLYVFDARDYSEPPSFGYSLPGANAGGAEFPSYTEPCAVVYSQPHLPLQIAMGMGLLGLRMIAINATPDRPEGRGFNVDLTPRIPFTPLQVARDMWTLDEDRMSRLRKHGIIVRRLDELHSLAREALDQAQKALHAGQYDTALDHGRRAWGFESRAYPDVQKTAIDVVKGVLFYLAMLLPFAWFGERLIFAFPSIHKQIAGTFGVFLVMFMVLRYVHPAFELSATPLIILLAFIIMALAVVVMSIVTAKFNEQLKTMKQEESGVHEADVGRLSAATAAFSLGIANMRRRPTRTGLTCITLVLLTFTVLSFTSVKSYLRANQIPRSYPPAYPGMMIRDRAWFSLEEPTYPIIANQLRGTADVAPRAWYTSADIEKQLVIDVQSAADSKRVYAANDILGLSPQEAKVTGVDQTVVAGRWFAPEDGNVCLLPTEMATALGIANEDVGAADVIIFGTPFRVIGIFDEGAFRQLDDLDGENMTPVDYALLRPEIIQEIKRQAEQRHVLGTGGAQSLLQEYKHFAPETMVILPYQRIMQLGGTLRSIAIRYHDPAAVGKQVRRLMKRFALSIYAGIGNTTYLFSSVGLTSFGGAHTILVPIIIAALIVLNTMLGSVYERVREIGIYSSLGLAPVHVSMLFLAESAVFANIGAILGYLIGQILAKVLFVTGKTAASGLELNYSSTSSVLVSVIVIAVVLLSTLYPSRRASDIASPGIERKWRMPDPVGDDMLVTLPFTVTGRDAAGSCAFLKEFFDEYVGYAGGEFLAEDVRLDRVDTPNGPGPGVSLRMWLAPYDLGVSQKFDLVCIPTGDADVHSIELRLHREAGDITSWKKTNSLFLTSLRKQFLIWRTVPVGSKARYAERGRAVLAGQPDPGHSD